MWPRPCAPSVVAELYAEHTAGKGSEGTAASAKLDDAGGFCGGRVTIVDFTPEWMVNRCGARGADGVVERALV
jgi:hypothetical protein